mgnify:CR=1 FL=1
MNKLDVRNHLVQSLEALRELVGTPHEAVVQKSVAVIDDQAKNYIARSPMMFLSSSNEQGQCDVSPRGDYPGFVYVANAHQLIIPERPGNRRADSLSNIIKNPHVGMVFLIPGMEEVLRVNGQAVLIREHPVLEKLQWQGKAPAIGILVDVEECYVHCPRALKSAGIWNQESWPPKEQLPSSKDIFHAHLKINGYRLE